MVYGNKKDLIEKTIASGEKVLDTGFWGQGTGVNSPNWVHRLLKERGADVWGIDLEYDEKQLQGDISHYRKASAESFSLPEKFDTIFAGDIIEHLSNPGLFLDASKQHLKPSGKLVLTTPNAFNLFNIAEKFSKDEPTVNSDHTFYFNKKTLSKLLEKNGWMTEEVGYVYSLELTHKESIKKKLLNFWYALFATFTPKFIETLVVIAKPRP